MEEFPAKFITRFNQFLMVLSQGMDGIKFKDKTIGSDIFLINYIGANPNCSMTEISKFLKIIPSTSTRRVEKLVSLGVVERFSKKSDRRTVNLKLSPEGQALYAHYLQKRLIGIEELVHKFSLQDIETFLSILDFLLEKGKNMVSEFT